MNNLYGAAALVIGALLLIAIAFAMAAESYLGSPDNVTSDTQCLLLLLFILPPLFWHLATKNREKTKNRQGNSITEKRKFENIAFILGDDGELMPLSDEESLDEEKQKR